jgi:adenylylsulfate kinase
LLNAYCKEGYFVQQNREGLILWFTGLSGSGKTTLAKILEQRFASMGQRVELLDGDVVRTNLSKGLGFSKEDRDTNVRRIGFVAHLLQRNGVFAICSAISPYKAIRDEIRQMAGERFVEIFADCPIDVCATRDGKQEMYAKARRGELPQFTGVSDPYEDPPNPEIWVKTNESSVDACVEQILASLVERGLLVRERLESLA